MLSSQILYVDDDEGMRRAFRLALRGSGLNVDLACCGQEAIELVGKKSYAVVATDLEMPGIDGVELVDRLHQTAPKMSFVLVTGVVKLDLPTDSESARSISCVIRKPWESDALQSALRRGISLFESRMSSAEASNEEASGAVRVLLIEDNPRDVRLIHKMLDQAARHHYEVVPVSRLSLALAELEADNFHLILADLSLPDARGMDAVARLQASVPSTPIIVMSGHSDEVLALQAVQLGAQDYLVKGDLNHESLHRSIRYAVERKRTEERLAHLAHHDQLTSLANGALFRERADHALKRAGRTGSRPAILLLDVDRLKLVNESMGHDVGDAVLINVADRLSGVTRGTDTIARLRGDEFALLIDDIAQEHDLAAPAKRMISSLETSVCVGDDEIPVTASIGIAVYPDNGESVTELLKSADSAVLRAKESGRNNYQFYDRQMHARALERMQLERDLSRALERGEFEVYYQPLNRVSTGRPESFEALLRWKHPEHGMISPGRFIPLLEDLGHIDAVGEWVLSQACTQIGEWQQRYGSHFRVAVNLSALQFEDPALVAKVARAVADAEIEPHSLELEVTEGLIMRDLDGATRALERLNCLGVRIAIDDFGTGYSQLTYLVRFPVDVLKIDRSVTQLIGSANGNTVTKAVIEMAHTLGLEVVAEGVEEEAQLQFLRDHSCDVYQGYFIARPASAECCQEWLDSLAPAAPDQHQKPSRPL